MLLPGETSAVATQSVLHRGRKQQIGIPADADHEKHFSRYFKPVRAVRPWSPIHSYVKLVLKTCIFEITLQRTPTATSCYGEARPWWSWAPLTAGVTCWSNTRTITSMCRISFSSSNPTASSLASTFELNGRANGTEEPPLRPNKFYVVPFPACPIQGLNKNKHTKVWKEIYWF